MQLERKVRVRILLRFKGSPKVRESEEERRRGGGARMHIRVKRKNVTIFCEVQPDETVLEVKQRIQELTDKKPEEQKLVLDGVRDCLLESVYMCAVMVVLVSVYVCVRVCVRVRG